MPIKDMFWAAGAGVDIHLVPDLVGPQLDQLIYLKDDTDAVTRADEAVAAGIITLTCAPTFVVGDPFAKGIAVTLATGEVTITAPLAAPDRVLEFLVLVTVTETPPPPPPATAFTGTLYVRIHVHDGIRRIWLTPPTLTMREGARRGRFTLLGEFSDGRYGDLDSWIPTHSLFAGWYDYVRWVRSGAAPLVTWICVAPTKLDPSGNPIPIIAVDVDTGQLVSNADAGRGTVTAAISPLFTPRLTADGFADCASGWATPVALDHVAGPGFESMSSARNVLFLSDGFVASDRGAFESLGRQIAHRLQSRRRVRPYDLLKDQFNYFSGWVPSRDAGISVLPEVVRSFPPSGPAQAVETDAAIAPIAAPATLVIGIPGTPATNDYFLLNECDTALHMALGGRPRAERSFELRNVHFHANRMDDADFNDFLTALSDAAGSPVGNVWASGQRDEDLVLILCRSQRLGGSNNSREPSGKCIGMTMGREDEHRVETRGGQVGWYLIADDIPARADIDMWTTAAHEIAHSFQLGDEYGDNTTAPSDLDAIRTEANLQVHDDVLNVGKLDGELIRWRWPRIEKAGAIKTDPLFIGPETEGLAYTMILESGHGAAFAFGDIVRARPRPLLGPVAPSDRLSIIRISGDLVTVVPLGTGIFDTSLYPAGSILMAPLRGPPTGTDPDGEDLELVHADIRARVTATGNPLNAASSDPPNRACVVGPLPSPTPATNFVAGKAPRPPRHSYWIVGLYDNGRGYDCGVYRPTGICQMRSHNYKSGFLGIERAHPFCPVCRYVMVDHIDPSKHGDIDRDYGPRYPK